MLTQSSSHFILAGFTHSRSITLQLNISNVIRDDDPVLSAGAYILNYDIYNKKSYLTKCNILQSICIS